MSVTWRTVWVLPIIAAIAMFALVWGVSAAGAQPVSYSANLSASELTTPVTSTATGSFSATYSDGTITFSLNTDAAGSTAAHIHLGAAGEDGAPVAGLYAADPAIDGIATSGSFTEARSVLGRHHIPRRGDGQR